MKEKTSYVPLYVGIGAVIFAGTGILMLPMIHNFPLVFIVLAAFCTFVFPFLVGAGKQKFPIDG